VCNLLYLVKSFDSVVEFFFGNSPGASMWIPLEEVETYDLTRSFHIFFRQHKDELKRL